MLSLMPFIKLLTILIINLRRIPNKTRAKPMNGR